MEEDQLGTGSSRALDLRYSDMIGSSCLAAWKINPHTPHVFLNRLQSKYLKSLKGLAYVSNFNRRQRPLALASVLAWIVYLL